MVTQSPIRTKSLAAIWILATKPKIVSLKTSNSTADNAPIAVKKYPTSFPVSMENITIIPIVQISNIKTCM